jgi:hypothetical protein
MIGRISASRNPRTPSSGGASSNSASRGGYAGEPVQIGTLVTSTNGKQMRSGDVVETKDVEIRIGRIHPQTPYVLYFVNRTERLVEIDVPSEGRTENFNKPELNIKFAMKLGRTSGLSLMASSNASKVPQ